MNLKVNCYYMTIMLVLNVYIGGVFNNISCLEQCIASVGSPSG